MVKPETKKLTYKIDMKRVIMRRLVIGLGDGVVEADGEAIYQMKDVKVGLFAMS